jgi:hypothetical protein
MRLTPLTRHSTTANGAAPGHVFCVFYSCISPFILSFLLLILTIMYIWLTFLAFSLYLVPFIPLFPRLRALLIRFCTELAPSTPY